MPLDDDFEYDGGMLVESLGDDDFYDVFISTSLGTYDF